MAAPQTRTIRRDLSIARSASGEDSRISVPFSRLIITTVPAAFTLRFGSSDADPFPVDHPLPIERCDGQAIGDIYLENPAASGELVMFMSNEISIGVGGSSADGGASSGGVPYIVVDDLGAAAAVTTFPVYLTLGRLARAGSVTAPDANVDVIEFRISANGTTFSGWYPLQPAQSYDLQGIEVHTIEVRPTSANDDVVIEAH